MGRVDEQCGVGGSMRIEYDEGTEIIYDESLRALTHPGYFHKGRVMCEDGKIRGAEVHNIPDTFFSVRARVRMYGTTVTGFVTIDTTSEKGTVKFYGGKRS
jgi:hypothetical protein